MQVEHSKGEEIWGGRKDEEIYAGDTGLNNPLLKIAGTLWGAWQRPGRPFWGICVWQVRPSEHFHGNFSSNVYRLASLQPGTIFIVHLAAF